MGSSPGSPWEGRAWGSGLGSKSEPAATWVRAGVGVKVLPGGRQHRGAHRI